MTRDPHPSRPDEDGFYDDEFIALGMRRLKIIDLVTGHQPITNEDKTIWTIFNGEIFNFPQLRAELEREVIYLKPDLIPRSSFIFMKKRVQISSIA